MFFFILKQTHPAEIPFNKNWAKWSRKYGQQLSEEQLFKLAEDPRNAEVNLSPVHIAILSGIAHPDRFTLKQMNQVDHFDHSATFFAVARSNYPMLKILIQNRIHLYTNNRWGENPFSIAVRDGKKSVVKALLNAGIDPDYHLPLKTKPLKTALIFNRFDIFRQLIEGGSNIHEPDPHTQQNILHEAAMLNKYPLIKEIICKYHISPLIPDKHGALPHHLAAKEGHLEALKELQAGGADLKIPDFEGWTALDYAVSGVHFPVVMWLLEQEVPLGQNTFGERIFDCLPNPLRTAETR